MDALDIVSLVSAKSWLSVDEDDASQDEAITRLIKTAVDWVEKYTSWRLYQREEYIFNNQDNCYVPSDYFPDYGSGFWPGRSGVLWTPKHVSIYLYPFTITSVTDLSSPPSDVQYTTVRQPLRTLLYAAPNSMITLQTGFALSDVGKISPPLIDTCYKLITYLFENRDMYNVQFPTDIQMMINQYRRSII
jgi:hypothetical protein